MSRQNLKNVILRELEIWRKRPIFVVAPLAVMAFCSFFYLTFLGDGLPSDLPIGVVDNDNSSLSRNFVRQLDATQLGKVVHYDTFADARNEDRKSVV